MKMGYPGISKRSKVLGMGAVIALGLLLSACLLTPGKFTSTLDVRKDGRFTFTYLGELYFLSPDEMSDKASKSEDATFQPDPCTADDGATRDCSSAELDQQMRQWEEREKSRASGETAQMAAMFGGKNMDDPQTAQEFARSLERQQGWRRVTYKGKGLFDVDYAISGTLSHDFVFPVMEQFPIVTPFVQMSLRKDGSVRIDAPAFASGAAGGPLKSLGAMASSDPTKKSKAPNFPKMDGTFTIISDGQILANNTDEGAQQTAAGDRLLWKVNDKTAAAPTALIRLAR